MPPSYRDLPAVHEVLADPRLTALPTDLCTSAVRAALEQARQGIQQGSVSALPDIAGIAALTVSTTLSGRLRPVLNATGVVIHTNLGRAVWAPEAIAAASAASGYCNLEMSLGTGERGGRTEGVRRLICALTGAEDAVVVNNCAAALLLSLTALARDRDVLVSRGELVEIGGSFRVPDIIEAGGATLVCVGTTNRTRASDFERGASERARVLLTVHPSNFRIVGFTESVDRAARQAVAERLSLLHVEDVGSGSLESEGGEPGVRDAVAAGVHVVLFSGDKLLGGPQCGFAVGRTASIRSLRSHPMYRAMRLDKTRIAAIEATLSLIASGGITPASAMLSASDASLRHRVERLSSELTTHHVPHDIVRCDSATGGGARPDIPLPSWACAVHCDHADDLVGALRRGPTAVLARIVRDDVWLDVRTLPGEALSVVAEQVARALCKR